MISKDLLSAVLGESITEIQLLNSPSIFGSKQLWITSKSHDCAINIYELAHKCKEWALLKHGFTITSFIFRIDAYPIGEYDGAAVLFFPDNETPSIRFDEATIAEAIVKACQWILDSKSTS